MKNYSPLILFFMGILAIVYAFNRKETASAFQNVNTPAVKSKKMAANTHHSHDAHHTHTQGHSHTPSPAITPPPLLPHTSVPTTTAVSHMNSLLKTYALGEFTLNDVIEDLEKRKMDPALLKDSNPHTGTMYVLRTDSPLPGTRYFHAQYFTDDKKEPFLQHMSFDMKPDKTAFQDAIHSIKQIFGKLGTPKIQTKNFIMWPWKKGYNVWVQKLDKDQLSGDPYNAYAANDVGTVKIAVELDTFHNHEH